MPSNNGERVLSRMADNTGANATCGLQCEYRAAVRRPFRKFQAFELEFYAHYQLGHSFLRGVKGVERANELSFSLLPLSFFDFFFRR